MPVSRSVFSKAATSAERLGWLVVPAMDAGAAATAAAPAEGAAYRVGSWPAAWSRGLRVAGVGTGGGGRVQGRQLTSSGVMGVHVHRQVEVLTQSGDELRRRRRTQQTGHVLDGQHMGAGVDDLLGQAQVVVEGVELLG